MKHYNVCNDKGKYWTILWASGNYCGRLDLVIPIAIGFKTYVHTLQCPEMSSVYHLHVEAEMLKVREHSELLSPQYLARCLEPVNVVVSTHSLDPCLWGSPIIPLVVHQPASPSIWPAVQSLRWGLSTNPGMTTWCVCGCS